jgi:hypothetical protein
MGACCALDVRGGNWRCAWVAEVFQDAASAFWLPIQQQRDRVAVRVHPKVIYAWPSPINAVKKCRHIK